MGVLSFIWQPQLGKGVGHGGVQGGLGAHAALRAGSSRGREGIEKVEGTAEAWRGLRVEGRREGRKNPGRVTLGAEKQGVGWGEERVKLGQACGDGRAESDCR